MALTRHALFMLKPHMRGADVLSFGYPDLVMSVQDAEAITQCTLVMRSGHGAAHKRAGDIPDTTEVFEAMGAKSCTYLDAMPSRGEELQVDLNEPLPTIMRGAYDLVIDAGTMEHCANVGQALMNAASSVRQDGVVFHSPPLSMTNHGFYNINPTLLVDFYSQNGWEVRALTAFSVRNYDELVPVLTHERFKASPDLCLIFMAQRMTNDALRWPTQDKYLRRNAA